RHRPLASERAGVALAVRPDDGPAVLQLLDRQRRRAQGRLVARVDALRGREKFCRRRVRGGSLMKVQVKLPTALRPFAGGQESVAVEGATAGDALDALFGKNEGLKKQ